MLWHTRVAWLICLFGGLYVLFWSFVSTIKENWRSVRAREEPICKKTQRQSSDNLDGENTLKTREAIKDFHLKLDRISHGIWCNDDLQYNFWIFILWWVCLFTHKYNKKTKSWFVSKKIIPATYFTLKKSCFMGPPCHGAHLYTL